MSLLSLLGKKRCSSVCILEGCELLVSAQAGGSPAPGVRCPSPAPIMQEGTWAHGTPTADPGRVLAPRAQTALTRGPSFQQAPQPHGSLSAASNFPCIFHKHQPQVSSPPPWCVQQTQVSERHGLALGLVLPFSGGQGVLPSVPSSQGVWREAQMQSQARLPNPVSRL